MWALFTANQSASPALAVHILARSLQNSAFHNCDPPNRKLIKQTPQKGIGAEMAIYKEVEITSIKHGEKNNNWNTQE